MGSKDYTVLFEGDPEKLRKYIYSRLESFLVMRQTLLYQGLLSVVIKRINKIKMVLNRLWPEGPDLIFRSVNINLSRIEYSLKVKELFRHDDLYPYFIRWIKYLEMLSRKNSAEILRELPGILKKVRVQHFFNDSAHYYYIFTIRTSSAKQVLDIKSFYSYVFPGLSVMMSGELLEDEVLGNARLQYFINKVTEMLKYNQYVSKNFQYIISIDEARQIETAVKNKLNQLQENSPKVI